MRSSALTPQLPHQAEAGGGGGGGGGIAGGGAKDGEGGGAAEAADGESGGGAEDAAPALAQSPAGSSVPGVNGNQNEKNVPNKQSPVNNVSNNSTTITTPPQPAATTTTVTTTSNGNDKSTSKPHIGVGNGATTDAPLLQLRLLHDPGITADWSVEEQSTLDEGLIKFAGESSNLSRYIKIANLLPEKTARDVAMRCRWMTKKEIGKRRKPEDQNASKKNKEKKDKSESVANKASQSHTKAVGVPSYMPPAPPGDNDDGISNDAIGGTTGQLLEHNNQIIAHIRSNFVACKLTENTDHLVRFRDNIFAILNGMTNMPGIMSQMPPLPVKLDTELADTILPKSLQAAPPS